MRQERSRGDVTEIRLDQDRLIHDGSIHRRHVVREDSGMPVVQAARGARVGRRRCVLALPMVRISHAAPFAIACATFAVTPKSKVKNPHFDFLAPRAGVKGPRLAPRPLRASLFATPPFNADACPLRRGESKKSCRRADRPGRRNRFPRSLPDPIFSGCPEVPLWTPWNAATRRRTLNAAARPTGASRPGSPNRDWFRAASAGASVPNEPPRSDGAPERQRSLTRLGTAPTPGRSAAPTGRP